MRTFVSTAAMAAAGVLFCVASAQAQNGLSYVSGLGSDSNRCTLTEPCRNFAKALSVTNAGGEIAVLDSATYNAFTIDKPIWIRAQNVNAEIVATSGNAITISATQGIVGLSGLNIEGAGSIGVDVTTSEAVRIANCDVDGTFTMGGVVANGGPLIVENSSLVMNNESDGGAGILTNGGVTNIRSTRVLGAAIGVSAGGTTTITDSYFAANDTAISSAAGSIAIARNLITLNGTGLSVNEGAILSFGDNDVVYNGTEVSGSLTPASKM